MLTLKHQALANRKSTVADYESPLPAVMGSGYLFGVNELYAGRC
jgi:hypothetical protein